MSISLTPAARLQAVREHMSAAGLDAFIVPRADSFLGEYIAPDQERLHWLTGFTGSAGVAIVLHERAAVFVDGRYTVQVREQVDATAFDIHHLIDTPQIPWLIDQLPSGAIVGCDSRLHSLRWFEQASQALAAAELRLQAVTVNPVDANWQDRPRASANEVLLLGEQFTGVSSVDKRQRIASMIQEQGGDALLVFACDSLSWLLNLRGTDTPQLPVVYGLGVLHRDSSLDLFLDSRRLPEGFVDHVGPNIRVHAPDEYPHGIAGVADKKVLADFDGSSAWTLQRLHDAGATLLATNDPIQLPKACKNAVEQAGSRSAHRRDGVALVRFLAWLDAEVAAGRLHDEATLSERLYALRAEGEHFHACSFDTISAAAGNAAMCHYNHLNATVPAHVVPGNVYLVDSGGQYSDGTTDITRTVAIGEPEGEIRRLFTLVLKGHIALAQARFPRGTTGTHLDVLARQFLWREGYDFDHGTGHGVGAFLSVHEGPQRISKAYNAVALQPGMIVSNEPGYYRDGADGAFGIRCENLVLVQPASEADQEVPMLAFETLSLAPFDRRLIDLELLDDGERAWLDQYHSRVREALSPLLGPVEQRWLAQATAPLS